MESKYALVLTAAKKNAGYLQVANAIFKGARSADIFAFAISFCTFNKVFRLRQFSASKPALLLAANRYL
ncbi:hypothetical protein BH10BAC1_BH10BAC1_16900 [soil metagenome]